MTYPNIEALNRSETSNVENPNTNSTTETAPAFRDLSSPYGQSGRKRDPNDVIPALNLKHPIFLIIASLGFGALYAELLFFVATYYGNSLGTGTNIALIAGTFIVVTGGMYLSFVLPHRWYRSRFQNYSPIIFLIVECTVSIIMLLVVNLAVLVAGIFMVDGELGAVGELLRSLALYAIGMILLYHGIAVYVRYVRFLYEREMHESYKIVSFAGVLAILVMIITLYLLQFDLGRMGGSLPNQGWLSLHLSIRDVLLLAMTFFVFIWHTTVLADH